MQALTQREAVMRKHAPRILELAEAALVAVQALMAAEDAAKAELGQQRHGLFGSDDTSLDDAETAVACARHCAEQVLNLIKEEG
jgi:hypothetical protein